MEEDCTGADGCSREDEDLKVHDKRSDHATAKFAKHVPAGAACCNSAMHVDAETDLASGAENGIQKQT